MILNGVTRAARLASSILSGRPSMYRLVDEGSFRFSMRDLNESGGSVATGEVALTVAYTVPGILWTCCISMRNQCSSRR